jgi:hypothetical protein
LPKRAPHFRITAMKLQGRPNHRSVAHIALKLALDDFLPRAVIELLLRDRNRSAVKFEIPQFRATAKLGRFLEAASAG